MHRISSTNRTLRSCRHCTCKKYEYVEYFTSRNRYTNVKLPQSLNNKSRWKLVDILNKHIALKTKNSTKITVKKNMRYFELKWRWKFLSRPYNPHPHFAPRRPNFIFEPDVKFAIVNKHEFQNALILGNEYFHYHDEQDLFHVSEGCKRSVVYITGNQKSNRDRQRIDIHACGGYFDEYIRGQETFSVGPRVKGLITQRDREISNYAVMHTKSEEQRYCSHKCTREQDFYDRERSRAARIGRKEKQKRRFKQLMRRLPAEKIISGQYDEWIEM